MPSVNPYVSVVVPVYRSEDTLTLLVERLERALESWPHEIVLINDDSPDGSWETIVELAARYPTVKALSLRKTFGYDNALMAGLNHCTGKYVVTMDDDLQHAPEDIPALVAEIEQGADVVYANFAAFQKQQSWIKNLGSWLNGKLAEYILSKPKEIYLSPFKILSQELVREIKKYTGPYPYIDGLVFQRTAAIRQIPIVHHARKSGRGNHGIVRSARIMANFWTSHSLFPLRVAVVLGFFLSFCAGLFGLFLIYYKLVDKGFNVEGWASTVFAILLMGGVQILSVGIIGEYVGRSHMTASQSPQYVVRHRVRVE